MSNWRKQNNRSNTVFKSFFYVLVLAIPTRLWGLPLPTAKSNGCTTCRCWY